MPIVIQGAIAIGGNIQIGPDAPETYRNSLFDSRYPPAQGAPVVPASSGAWNEWMNKHAVYTGDSNADFDRTYTLTFPITGTYEFKGSVDDSGWVDLDGSQIFVPGGFADQPRVQLIDVAAGVHTIALHARQGMQNSVMGIALTIRYGLTIM